MSNTQYPHNPGNDSTESSSPSKEEVSSDMENINTVNKKNNLSVDTNSSNGYDMEVFNTPVDKSAPFFQSVNSLPTPMAYTPTSFDVKRTLQSPTNENYNNNNDNHSPIIMAKKRLSSDGSRTVSPTDAGKHAALTNRMDTIISSYHNEQRVVSELPPFQNGPAKRIVSVPLHPDLPIGGTISSSSRVGLEKENLNTLVEDDENIDEDQGININIIRSDKGTDDTLTGYLLDDDLQHPLHWRRIKQIGVGNFSTVYLYESLDQSHAHLREVAVKRIKYPIEITNLQFRDSEVFEETLSRLENSLTREISVLKSIDHPCIVQFYGINNPVFVQQKKPLKHLVTKYGNLPPCDIILSYCSGGDLLSAVTKRLGRLDQKLIQRIFAELVVAVKYLHENSIIHRDLKLENILLRFPLETIVSSIQNSTLYKQQNMTQLTDFGLCKKLVDGELCNARCGSEDYVCPEILMGIPYDGFLSDTWALGVILYGLLEDRLPFDPPPNANARQKNRSVSHRIARFEWRWFNTQESDSLAKEIVKNTLTRKSTRWDIQTIYESPYVQEILEEVEFLPK